MFWTVQSPFLSLVFLLVTISPATSSLFNLSSASISERSLPDYQLLLFMKSHCTSFLEESMLLTFSLLCGGQKLNISAQKKHHYCISNHCSTYHGLSCLRYFPELSCEDSCDGKIRAGCRSHEKWAGKTRAQPFCEFPFCSFQEKRQWCQKWQWVKALDSWWVKMLLTEST